MMSDEARRPVLLKDVQPRPKFMRTWERVRHRQAHWLCECLAEALGVFLYVWAGVGSTAVLTLGNLAPSLGLSGSLLHVGFGYTIGIVLALVICAPTSGGHFSPGVTICLALFGRFPVKKVPRYIVAQILGSYVACLCAYGQYKGIIDDVEALLESSGKLATINFTPQGPAGIFGLYVAPGSYLGYVFLNEFVITFVIGLAIWTCLDPTNLFIPPPAAPWVIALTYAVCIWGYVPVGMASNTARDVGGRLAAMTIWGLPAAGNAYSAIAALTNILATICAAVVYDTFLRDDGRVVTAAHKENLDAHAAHAAFLRSHMLTSDHESQRNVMQMDRQTTLGSSTEEREKDIQVITL